MKGKLVAILTLCIVLCTALCGLTACDSLPSAHTHVYNQRNTSETYLKSDATCETKAVYYYSCECGDVGSVAFENGDYAEHSLGNDGCCLVCSAIVSDTMGVLYDKSADGTYMEVIGYEGASKKVKIADTYNGLPVKTIYEEAFYNNDNINMVIIPDSVTSIGDWAFYSCDSLTSVTIGDSVTSIDQGAFLNCSSLEYIYCEAESKPDGWYSGWNKKDYYGNYHKVVWGY